MGADSLFEISVPHIAAVPDDNNLSEGHLAYMLYTEELVRRSSNATIAVYHDEESDMLQFKSFDFDYTDAVDPLLEKIFKVLEQELLQKGWYGINRTGYIDTDENLCGAKGTVHSAGANYQHRVQTVYNWRWAVPILPNLNKTRLYGLLTCTVSH
ncbi:MAG: hypothetical protein IPH18_12060 [Chitinophagaceae bacterium]|nr:hypothetical protein [Chitinophagaceae bacterium]